MVPALALTALMGSILGSFLNVVAWRLPRGESLVHPRLALPGLRRAGQALRQRPGPLAGCCCAGTAAPAARRSAPRYPLVEALTAALYAGRRRRALGRRDRDRARPRARDAARPDGADRPRAPHHPQPR